MVLSIVEPQERRILVDTRDVPGCFTSGFVPFNGTAVRLKAGAPVVDRELITIRVILVIIAVDSESPTALGRVVIVVVVLIPPDGSP